MADTSTRFQILEPSANRLDSADVPRDIRAIVAALESRGMLYGQGLLSAMPAAGKAGRIYFATDTPTKLYFDYGGGWATIGSTAIAPGSITSVELADNAVTLPKMANVSVGSNELIYGSVLFEHISATLKPSAGAPSNFEAIRSLGRSAGQAAAGTEPMIEAPYYQRWGGVNLGPGANANIGSLTLGKQAVYYIQWGATVGHDAQGGSATAAIWLDGSQRDAMSSGLSPAGSKTFAASTAGPNSVLTITAAAADYAGMGGHVYDAWILAKRVS